MNPEKFKKFVDEPEIDLFAEVPEAEKIEVSEDDGFFSPEDFDYKPAEEEKFEFKPYVDIFGIDMPEVDVEIEPLEEKDFSPVDFLQDLAKQLGIEDEVEITAAEEDKEDEKEDEEESEESEEKEEDETSEVSDEEESEEEESEDKDEEEEKEESEEDEIFPNPEKNHLVDTYKDVAIYDCTCGKFVAMIDGKKVKKETVDELKKCIDGECEEELEEDVIAVDAPKADVPVEVENEKAPEKKVCDKCGKEICECGKKLKESEQFDDFDTQIQSDELIPANYLTDEEIAEILRDAAEQEEKEKANEGLLGAAALGALGGIGAAHIASNLLGEEKCEDCEDCEEALIKNSPVSVNIDASGFGGSGNDVSVLSPSDLLGEEKIKEMVENWNDNEDEVECAWCEEVWPKAECRKEMTLGYLCPECQAAIKSRGEKLVFEEGCKKK